MLPSLAGRTILIDPGHNGGNASHEAAVDAQVFVGNGHKECDTTGTETNAGYPEYAFTLDVSLRLRDLLTAAGAHVVMTRADSNGVGPCVDQRARLGNDAHADLAISIHADGGPGWGRGFHVIEPGPVPGYNDGIVAPSDRFGLILRDTYAAVTGESPANYIASDGLITRTDLGGLNLSRVPKVFIECANMRNSGDAARLIDPAFRQREAQAIAAAMSRYFGG